MSELPIRSVTGPSGVVAPRNAEVELRRHIQDFKDLIRNVGRSGVDISQVSWPDHGARAIISEAPAQRPPVTVCAAGSERAHEVGEQGAGQLDEHAPGSSDPKVEQMPLPILLEPFAVLLGSIGTLEALQATDSRPSLLPERLAAEIVKTIAWGGDRRRGAARIELGGERFDGTTVTIEVEDDRLRLSLDTPPGVNAVELRERLTARLERRGLSVEAE